MCIKMLYLWNKIQIYGIKPICCWQGIIKFTVLYTHLQLSITCQNFTQQPSDTKMPVFISFWLNLFGKLSKECKRKRMKKGKCNLSVYKVSNVSLKQTVCCRQICFTVLELWGLFSLAVICQVEDCGSNGGQVYINVLYEYYMIAPH